jgi:hypothetical protein
LKCIKDLELFKDENIENFLDFISDLGCMFKEMLKIKLYPPYSTIMLGILSRTHTILNFVKENESKMMKNIDEIMNGIILVNSS